MNSVFKAKKILLGCDLDRTIIPNGIQKESPLARPLLRHLVQYPHIYLAYVSGRDQNLIRDAIDEFYLPMPDYAIGNVGTTLYGQVMTRGNYRMTGAMRLDKIGNDLGGRGCRNCLKMRKTYGFKNLKGRTDIKRAIMQSKMLIISD